MENTSFSIWVGDKSNKLETHLQCAESWKKFLSDYSYTELGNEYLEVCYDEMPSNIKNAFEKKKYAFVSDFLRVKYLYDNGGVYLDTDFELLRPLDKLPGYSDNFDVAFGMETSVTPGSSIIISKKKNLKFFKRFIDFYYENEDSKILINTKIIRIMLKEFGFRSFREEVDYKDILSPDDEIIRLYDRKYLYPVDWRGNVRPTFSDAVGLHHYLVSWLTNSWRRKVRIENCLDEKINHIKEEVRRWNDNE